MSIGIAALFGLLVIVIIAIPVLIVVFRSAGERNPNRAENEEDRARQERESGEQDTGE